MGLKDLTSQLDLVEGTEPVGNMVGQQGSQFQLPLIEASQKHVDSLQQVPGFSSNSPFQDLNGEPDPDFNTLNGTVDSPFQSQTGDHMVDLLISTAVSTNSDQIYNASSYDLNGLPGPQSQLPTPEASQAHIDSLQQVPQPPSNSPYQDLNGEPGPLFDNGPEPNGSNLIDTIHEQSLYQNYSYQYGNSVENVNATGLSLNGAPGTSFDNGPEPSGINQIDTIAETGLADIYISAINPDASYVGTWPIVNPSSLDKNGAPGLPFDNGPEPDGPNAYDTIAELGLIGFYNSAVNPDASYGAGQPGGTWPILNPSSLDKNGAPGIPFDNGPEPDGPNMIDTIAETGLAGIYNSIINPNASYGAGQPGGTYPAINPSLLDINGAPGLPFDNGSEPAGPNVIDTIAETGLESIYNSLINPGASYGAGQPGGVYPAINPSTLDLNGAPGPQFEGSTPQEQQKTLHTDLLANIYESSVNPLASYGAGQPGGSWPSIQPSPLSSTPFADLDGVTPGQYINNMPN